MTSISLHSEIGLSPASNTYSTKGERRTRAGAR